MTTAIHATVTFAQVVEALAAPGFGNGLLWMARAMAGEQGGVFPPGDCQAEVGRWIGHTVLNRVRDPRWPASAEQVVRGGFFGHVEAAKHPHLEMAMYRLALTVVIDRTIFAQDPTSGCYWMYSLHDLERWPGYKDKAVRCFVSGEYGLCFFREPPPAT